MPTRFNTFRTTLSSWMPRNAVVLAFVASLCIETGGAQPVMQGGDAYASIQSVGPCATTFKPQMSYGTGIDPTSVAIGDLDSDGAPDLAVANFGGVSVLLNSGDGTGTFVLDASPPLSPLRRQASDSHL